MFGFTYMYIYVQQMFMLFLQAPHCLLSSLFPAEILSSLYLDSAVFPSGSQCNDLYLPARTEDYSLSIFHCRLKTHLIKRDVMSPTQPPCCRIFPLHLHIKVKGKNLSWTSKYFLIKVACLSTQLLSHTLLPGQRDFRCTFSSLCLTPLFWLLKKLVKKELRQIA